MKYMSRSYHTFDFNGVEVVVETHFANNDVTISVDGNPEVSMSRDDLHDFASALLDVYDALPEITPPDEEEEVPPGFSGFGDDDEDADEDDDEDADEDADEDGYEEGFEEGRAAFRSVVNDVLGDEDDSDWARGFRDGFYRTAREHSR